MMDKSQFDEFKDIIKRLKSDEAIRLIQDLIRLPSENPPGKEEEIAQYVEGFMKGLGLEVSYFEFLPHRPNVVGIIKGSKRKPNLMFNGHLDVVPAGNIDLWKYDPFGGELIDGRIYGRGASDMKGGLTAMLLAAKVLKESGKLLNGDLIITTVSDEEVKGQGAKDIIKRGYRAEMAIIGEPTNLIPLRAHKGLIWLELKTIGKAMHSSFASAAKTAESNAIIHMTKILESLQNYSEQLELRKDSLVGPPTLNVGTIEGGSKTNVIPDNCRITVDRRLLPRESPDSAELEIIRILKNLEKEDPNLKIELKTILSRKGSVTSENSPIVTISKEAIEKIFKRQVEISGCPATSDMEIFVNQAGMPTILLGPGRLSLTHMIDEYIELDEILNAAKIYTLVALKTLS